MLWKPNVVVAAIIERDGRFLLVEEEADGAIVLNQPAGHLDEGERLVDAVVRDLQNGEVLLAEGVSDSSMHVVVSGAIAVARKGEGGAWNTLHLLGPGDFVGELSFMDDAPHYAALVASGPTRVFSLKREKFETLIDTHPRAVYQAMRSIMRVVHAIQRRLSMQMVELQNYIYKTHGRY